MKPVYEPSDDTYLLLDALKEDVANKQAMILDMGSGSGEIGFMLASKEVSITCVDINEEAITYMQNRAAREEKNIEIIHSDLFDNVELGKQFDYICFNTPYLPDEPENEINDIALHGGPNGNEVALKFLSQVRPYVVQGGKIFILISSLGKPEEVESYLDTHFADYEVVARKKLFFEELLVYKIMPKSVA